MNVYEPLPPGFNPLARITPALTLRKEKVASITAMIFFHIILHPAVLIYVIYGGYLLTNLGPRAIQEKGTWPKNKVVSFGPIPKFATV